MKRRPKVYYDSARKEEQKRRGASGSREAENRTEAKNDVSNRRGILSTENPS